MITGGCPYCDALVINYMPDRTPTAARRRCETCGKEYWMYYSRLDPTAYTLNGFAEEFVIDESTKSVTRRWPTT
jgi:hypothetical protein